MRVGSLGAIEAAVVIVAAGAWSGAIGGVPAGLAVRPVKGQILAFDNAPALVRHVLFREDVYLVPAVRGVSLRGHGRGRPRRPRRDARGARLAAEQAFETAPGSPALRFLRAWAGLRPATEDGLPVVGLARRPRTPGRHGPLPERHSLRARHGAAHPRLRGGGTVVLARGALLPDRLGRGGDRIPLCGARAAPHSPAETIAAAE